MTAPALQWFLAEGATGRFFDLFVLLANPNATAAAVTVDYLRHRRRRGDEDLHGAGAVAVHHLGRRRADARPDRASGRSPTSRSRRRSDRPTACRSSSSARCGGRAPASPPISGTEAHNSPGATVDGDALGGGRWRSRRTGRRLELHAHRQPVPAGRAGASPYFTEDGAGSGYYDVDLPPQSRTNVSLAERFPQMPAAGRRRGREHRRQRGPAGRRARHVRQSWRRHVGGRDQRAGRAGALVTGPTTRTSGSGARSPVLRIR